MSVAMLFESVSDLGPARRPARYHLQPAIEVHDI